MWHEPSAECSFSGGKPLVMEVKEAQQTHSIVPWRAKQWVGRAGRAVNESKCTGSGGPTGFRC